MEKFGQLKNSPPPEVVQEVPRATRTESGTSLNNLYDISETGDGFTVVLPGLYNKEREYIVGTRRKNFATAEEAEQAVKDSKERERIFFDKASLSKTFNWLFRIDETPEEKFKVTLPGLVDSSGSYYVGTRHREFDTWDQAKEYYIHGKEQEEKLTQNPLLELQTGVAEKIAFSGLDAFNPRVTPSEQTHEIPSSIKEYLMSEGRLDGSDSSAYTNRKTLENPGWDGKLFWFVSKYLETEGLELAKELGIEHLDALTPKQAVDLATQIVVDLTKYNWNDAGASNKDHSSKSGETTADQSTAEQILQEGLREKNNPDWEGNGVCRNFASSVKAVFEALKIRQTKFSQLRDTYCLYETGEEEFAPKREDAGVTKTNDFSGHAWNTFITFSKEGAANATIIDATWAKRNLDTKEIEGLDHTLLRMEPIVHTAGSNLAEEAPNKKGQLQRILSYYTTMLEGSSYGPTEAPPISSLNEQDKAKLLKAAIERYGKEYDLSQFSDTQIIEYELGINFHLQRLQRQERQDREKEFFTSRAISLMGKQGVPEKLPPKLVSGISEVYSSLGGKINHSEIETIHQIYKDHPELNFGEILERYLKNTTSGTVESYIFTDNNLQVKVFDHIKSRPDFDEFIKTNQRLRIRMREVLPQLFRDFSPKTNSEDAAELKYLAAQSRHLSMYGNQLAPGFVTEEKIRKLFDNARQKLRDKNPERYDAEISEMSDYELIKRFDELHRAIG
jgi:hypothetical protein